MSATDLAAIVLAIVCLAATVALVVAVQSLARTMRELRGVVDDLRDQTLPMVGELRNGVERVDHVIATAERITDTVDAASRLTSRALTPPLIKTVSIMAGARRVLHRGGSARSAPDGAAFKGITETARSAADGAAFEGITETARSAADETAFRGLTETARSAADGAAFKGITK